MANYVTTTFTVDSVEPVTPTIAQLWLSPREEPLDFVAGQYVLLEGVDGTPPARSYSIANAPRADGRISLLVTRAGPTSTWVHERLRPGDEVAIDGPYGTFVNEEPQRPALLLAAGSGLAPIRALIEAAPADGPPLTLLFSARTEADVMPVPSHPRLRFQRTLTRADGSPPTGRLPGQLSELAGDLSDSQVFIAGAPGFVSACAAAAERCGVPRVRIHTEVFFVEPQPWTS